MLVTAWLKSWKVPSLLSRRLSGHARRHPRGLEPSRLTPSQRAEFLEDRMLLTTLVVDTVADVLDGNTDSVEELLTNPGEDGKISLREAIMAGSSHGVPQFQIEQNNGDFGTTITFDPALTANGDATISLTMFDVDVEPPRVEGTFAVQPTSEFGPTAFEIRSDIAIVGPTGDNGIRIERASNAAEFRLFHIEGFASLSLVNLTLANGIARGGDQAVGVFDAIGAGGAIINEGTLSIVNSTLTGNQAVGGNGTAVDAPVNGGAGLGGAVFNFGGYVEIINSTVSGNRAEGGQGSEGTELAAPGEDGIGAGGGLFNLNGNVYLTNATFANNTALQGGGAVYNLSHESAEGLESISTNNAFLSLRNSILADSDGPNDLVIEQREGASNSYATAYAPNIVESPIITLGGAVTATEGSFDPGTYFMNVDPQLGALADNGGPTPTHLPDVLSPAIDQGDNDSANEITNPNNFGLTFLERGDQRNFQRIVDGDGNESSIVDLGAVEVGGTELPAVELDEFGDAFLTVVVDVGSGPQQLLLEGDTRHVTVFDGPHLGDANDSAETTVGRDDVQSYLFGEFEGFSPTLGWVTVHIFGENGATGGIEEAANNTSGRLDLPPFGAGTASSFFDVFINVSTELGTLHNDTPIHVTATVHAKPAAASDLFLFVADGDGPIVLSNEQGEPAAALSRVEYTPIPRLDFGDAPEAGTFYETTLIRDGARHLFVADGPRLGANIDLESNGQPSDNALGDDASGTPDDEDGVTVIGTLEVGKTATFQVNAPNGGILNAWLDYTGDGFWTSGEFETSEQFLVNEVLDPDDADGIYEFQIEIPFFPTIADGATYARFRINSTGNLGPNGLATDGEVEDYRVEILSHDFGDAPDSYGTTLAANGAQHVRRGPTLGTFSDAELDGQPGENATDDDAFGSGDDEDGVFFAPLVTGFLSQVTVSASEAGFVNAWFDFNGDGNFGTVVGGVFQDDPGEHIFTDVAVTAGENTLRYTVPASLSAGTTFARFRIASTAAGVNSPHGLAPDGEVEDYGLVIEGFDLPDPEDDPNPADTTFVFTVLQPVRRWYDPAIAIGYDYRVTDNAVQTLTLPILGAGDNLYTLHLEDFSGFSETATATLEGGVTYDFVNGFTDANGVEFASLGALTAFRILGIETAANVDPADEQGFVTGLSFLGMGGTFTMTGIPEKVYVDNVTSTTIVAGMAGDYAVTTDQGTIGTLDAGDTVTWFGSAGSADDVTGLVFGTTAFATVQSAIDSIEAANAGLLTMVQIGAGTFSEHLQMTGVSLVGAGQNLTFLDGSESGRVLEITGEGTVSIRNLTIQNGNVDFGGGGIRSSAVLTVSDSTIRDNYSGDGGGIQNNGTLTLVDSTVTDNRGTFGGGIFNNGTLTITDSVISDNLGDVDGGGIFTGGGTTITGSTISGNTAAQNGGGIRGDGMLLIDESTIDNNDAVSGAGIFNEGQGTLTITSSTISGNTASFRGGGIYNFGTVDVQSSTITGNTALSSDGGGIFNSVDGTLTVQDSNITFNETEGAGGGGLRNNGTATLTNSNISNNTADSHGGGIDNNHGNLTVLNCTISGNEATRDGGGGVNNEAEDATTSILNSTISGNSTDNDGGGIRNIDDATLTVMNSTISGNFAGNNGGGIANLYGQLLVANSTITGNRADSDGVDGGDGGGLFADGFDELYNSIVAGNFAGTGTTPNDIEGSGVVEIGDFNLIGDPLTKGGLGHGGMHGNIIGQDDGDGGRELLDIHTVLDTTLRDNGGPTLTHRLVFGSPAIDAGSNDLIPPDTFDLDGDNAQELVPFDQRGEDFPRIVGDSVDIGAYEKGSTFSNTFDVSLGKLVLTIPDPEDSDDTLTFTLFPQGPSTVAFEFPGEFDPEEDELPSQIFGELVSMNLTTNHPEWGEVVVTLNPNQTSVGTFEETDEPGVYSSFFDVFLAIHRPDEATLFNVEAIRIEAELELEEDGIETVVYASTDGPYELETGTGDLAGSIEQFHYTPTALDYGDAPVLLGGAGYPTLLVENGARHLLTTDGPFLGEGVDGDFDGEPTANADGDDTIDLNDDEDGVTFALLMRTSLIEDRMGSVTVTVSYGDEMAGAKLDAWIDFNQDGDWSDEGEQIANSLDVEGGDNDLEFTIPAGTRAGTTFSRFRVSTAGGLLSTGLAADGEVEDHAVTFFPELVEVTVVHGRLSIRDFGGQSNNITVTRDSRTNEFVVSSTANDLTADGITPTNVVRIPVANITGGVHGQLMADLSLGDDRLTLSSVSLNSFVTGGEGNDTILGGSGRDSLFGENGNDSVRGGSGDDTVSGGFGTDTVLGDAGTDTQREETDAAYVVVNRTSILGVGSTPGESESFGSGIERVVIIGGESNNSIDASASIRPVTLEGGDGDDTLLGSSSHDQLLGGEGNDLLDGNAGNDTVDGGSDDDTLTGNTGNDSIVGGGGTDTLVEARNVSFTLTNTSLTGNGTDVLVDLQIANLTGGVSSNTFTVSGWTGIGTLVAGGGGADMIVAVKDGDFTLTNTSLSTTSDGMELALDGFHQAKLTGGVNDNTFTVSEWTGTGTLSGGTGADTVVAERDANHTLTNTSLASMGFGTLILAGIENAKLTGGADNNTFTVSGWTGDGMLTGGGGIDTLVKSKNANFELSDEQLSTSDGMDLALDGFSVANLTGGSSNNVFIVDDWHGTGTINGSTSSGDRIEATRDANTTLTNALLTSIVEVSGFNGNGGFGALNLINIETANLSGGESDNTLNASQFTKGSVTLQGGAGNDVLIGGSKRDSLVGGSGRDLLIGGADKDMLLGEDGDDILIGGTSTHSGNMTALDAIMAEWTSEEDDYADRVSHLLNGGGANGTTKLNNTTVQNDSNAVDSLTGGDDTDWFFRSANDVLNAINGETVTAV